MILNILQKILQKKSPCRSLQEIECKNFSISGKCLEIGNNELNKKSFFKFIKNENKDLFFADTHDIKDNDYFKIDLEKTNNLNESFDNILIFNVLEHVYDIDNAFIETKKLLKNGGKIFISTPFIYRYHKAPKDYNRFTIDYFEKISKKNNLEIVYKNTLGTGPFLTSYSITHSLLNKLYPLNLFFAFFAISMDYIVNFFSKDLKNIYPISIFIVLKKN
jgi:SAM-dependent methyltransferase